MKKRVLMALLFIIILGSNLWIAHRSASLEDLILEHAIIIEGDEFTPSMAAYNFLEPGLKNLTYQVTLLGNAFKSDVEYYELLVFRLADNAHRVSFNEKIIGGVGDMVGGSSNLWNGLFGYTISSKDIRETNTLKIEATSSYRSGLSIAPLILLPYEEALGVKGNLYFFGEQINTLMIGFIFFSSFITLIFYFINGKHDKVYLLISLATFFTGVYYSSYLTLTYVGMPYLIYKKFVMTAMFFAIASYTYVISKYFNQKWLVYFGHVTVLAGLFMAMVAKDMVVYKQMYTYGYGLILINVIAWLIVTIGNLKKSPVAYIFFLGFLTLMVYGGITVTMDMTGHYFNFNSPVVYISVLSFMPLLLIYEAFKEKEIMIIKEKTLREQEITNAMTDNLTGTWNQRYMQMLFKEDIGQYIMTVLDIDNFKSINDTYGHLAGDYILRKVAQIIREHLRKTDVICRYGGDEFIMIKYDCNLEMGLKIMEKIRQYVEDYDFEYEGQKINVTISAGIGESKKEQTVESTFNEVDLLLYKAKSEGKNTIATSKRSYVH